MKKFEINGLYSMRSTCDHNCVWQYIVIKRTACTVTLKTMDGKTPKIITCRINKQASEYCKAETVYPLGHYSMAPALRA